MWQAPCLTAVRLLMKLRPTLLAFAAVAGVVWAQETEDLRRGVVRISFLNGEVSILRGDSGEWVAGAVNAPLANGDRLSTGMNSRTEIEFDSGDILRIGGGADVTLAAVEQNRYQIALGHGMATFRMLRQGGADIEVDTPNVSVRPSKIGSYRISVGDAGDTQVTSRTGDVEVFTPRGSQWVYAGQTMLARGTASDPEFQIVQAAGTDDWDRWNDSRDRPIANSPSQRYVPPGVYGTEDLDRYGNWVNVPQYGTVWQPVVPAGWAPYQAGRWVWMDWYGWTWVSYEPWGWAPYHYGRWFYAAPYGWCWYPGVMGVPHYWSPALVAFFGFGGGGVGFGFANVGWVPLAPYEVLNPWWGRAYYGTAGYFNRQVNIVNVNVTNTYRNAAIPNGVTAISAMDFRSGRFGNFVRPSAAELSQASFVRGPIPVAPERANLRFSDRAAGSIARGASARVFSYRGSQPALQRIPFGEQQRAFGSVNGGGAESNRGWTRFGSPTGQSLVRSSTGGAPNTRGESSGWQRFGEPYAGPRQSYSPPPAAQSQIPRQPVVQPQVGAAARFSSASRPEPLRVAPSVVRERSNAGGGGSRRAAPRNAPQRGSSGDRGNRR
jgi:FecR protein